MGSVAQLSSESENSLVTLGEIGAKIPVDSKYGLHMRQYMYVHICAWNILIYHDAMYL